METEADPCSPPRAFKPTFPVCAPKSRFEEIPSRNFNNPSGFDEAQADILALVVGSPVEATGLRPLAVTRYLDQLPSAR